MTDIKLRFPTLEAAIEAAFGINCNNTLYIYNDRKQWWLVSWYNRPRDIVPMLAVVPGCMYHEGDLWRTLKEISQKQDLQTPE